MATEYKLSYTAEEIDRRLGKVDEIEDKQDKLTFDEAPTEGSDNIVTSGAIHAALQNAGGGTDLVAGDFIEIKDGVVRCTFGDVISGELKEEVVNTYGTHVLEMMEDGLYMAQIPMNATGIPSVGDVLEVAFTPSGETTPTNFTVEATPFMVEDGETYMWSAGCNATLTLDMEFAVIDDTKPAFVLAFVYDDGELDAPMMIIASANDYTGATLTVGTKTVTDTRKYALLPDNALGLGREIVTEVNEELVNVESIEMEEDGVFMAAITPSKLPENGTILDVSFTPSGKLEPINFTAEVTELIIDGEFISWIASCNATFSFEDGSITAIDNTLPAFIIQMIYDDGDFDYPMMVIVSATDYTGASIVINNKAVKKTHVKLSNEALNFDTVPTKNSENLINSGSVYNAINSIDIDIDIEPQLVEGFYYYNRAINRDKNSIGLSANKRAIPTSQCAWVEGRAAEKQIYNNCALGRLNEYSGANVITYYGFETEGEAQWEIDRINNEYEYMFIIFEDELDKQYIIRKRNAYKTENRAGLYFYFEQIEGHEFPLVTTYPDTRNIKEVICLPKVGESSHSEGSSRASGGYSHAEGQNTISKGYAAHSEGIGTIANVNGSHAQGRYNIEDTNNKYAHIVGNGTSDDNRSNAHTVDWDGNAWFAGDIYVGDNKRVLTEGSTEGITISTITTDMIDIGVPGNNTISEIVSRTLSGASNGNILGSNILVPGWWYLVVYDGVEYTLTIKSDHYNYYMSGPGFHISQSKQWNTTNISTSDDNEHTITISRLETSRVNLMDYIFKLEDRIRQLEERLIEN